MRPLALLSLAFFLGACGSQTTEQVVDATADAPDAPLDVPPDTPADVPGDLGDSRPDAADAPADAPLDVPDTGVVVSAACASAGGVLCTRFRWDICPAGFEPVSASDHLDCGTAGGWCCRPAPPSSCAASGVGNCIATCPLDCWQPVTDTTLTCDGARKCCRDVCK